MLVSLAVIAVAAGYFYWLANMRLDPGSETYVVETGTSLRAFSQQLHEKGLLPDSRSLVWLAYMKGQSRALKAGEYRFRKGITPLQLLEQVAAGRVAEYPFLIVEGWTFRQVLDALDAAPKLTRVLKGMQPEEVMRALGYPGLHPEGRLYPDTYYYARGTSDLNILQSAFNKMETFLEREWERRDPLVPFKTPYEALIMASIVEKETGQPAERELIAGVFVNRLKKKMRLQTDPTVIYGMGKDYRGNIRLKDLRRDTPYNTYTRHGLPPTPIALPGGAAIRAALNPAKTDALFFVSRNDGSHIFSTNLQDHNNAVIQYQLGGKPRAFSSKTEMKREKPVAEKIPTR